MSRNTELLTLAQDANLDDDMLDAIRDEIRLHMEVEAEFAAAAAIPRYMNIAGRTVQLDECQLDLLIDSL